MDSGSLGNVAIFCVVVSVQLAVLCVPLARRGDHAATARWRSAALVAQAIRLALIGASDTLPAASERLLTGGLK